VGCLGYPHPGMTLAFAERVALPVFLDPAPIQRRDSLDVPLLRFNSPSRFIPETPVLILSVQDNSPGICFPFNAYRHRKITSIPFDREAVHPGPKTRMAFVDGSHPVDYGAAHRLSQPLSDLPLSLPSCRFQTGGAHGVCPTGIYSFHEASRDSSPPEYPPAVAPAGCAAPDPRPGHPLGVRTAS
jgi:hypothetical protein